MFKALRVISLTTPGLLGLPLLTPWGDRVSYLVGEQEQMSLFLEWMVLIYQRSPGEGFGVSSPSFPT